MSVLEYCQKYIKSDKKICLRDPVDNRWAFDGRYEDLLKFLTKAPRYIDEGEYLRSQETDTEMIIYFIKPTNYYSVSELYRRHKEIMEAAKL